MSIDSITHAVTIKTDLESRGSGGAVKLFDPWFVDSSSFRNYNTSADTLLLNSPFLPFVAPLNGGAKPNYGGVFLHQNEERRPLPMYGLGAYQTITSDTHLGVDSFPRWSDWSFIEFWKNDDSSMNDPEDWTNSTLKQKSAPVVFRRDSSTYIARYKAHMASFAGGPVGDAGFSWNNQRKVFYLHTDSLGNPWYRVVYSSAGRIFTSLGWRNHVTSAMTFLPEQLISDWADTSAMFPAMSFHGFTTPEDTAFHYVYNADGGTILFGQFVHDSLHSTIYDASLTQALYGATPVISGTDPDYWYGREPLDVVAWHAWDGSIHVAAADLIPNTPVRVSSEYVINPPLYDYTSGLYDTIEARPSIWMDSVWTYSGGYATTHFWVAFQARDTVPLNPTDTETFIYAIELQAVYDGMHTAPTISTVPGQPPIPTNITKIGNPAFISGKHCCISGCRIKSDTEVVRVSFEALEDPIAGIEGISVVQWRTGRGWVADHFFQSPDATTDKYTNPSIEVSRYHGASTSAPHDNYYSLSHERKNGTWTQSWAFDSAASRYTPSSIFYFLNTNHPQLSVVPNSHDSLIRQLGLSAAAVDPLWIIYNTGGVFKMGSNDSLWQYHAVSEFDSTGTFSVKAQIGEISYDDGSNDHSVDLADRNDALTVDSSHKAPFFLSSEAFTLPSSGSLSYYLKIAPSNDSLYRLHLDTLKYTLVFVDTVGTSYVLDSMLISDSTSHLKGATRTLTLNQAAAMFGHLELRRLTLKLRDTGAQWQDIITQSRLSADSSYKRGKAILGNNDVLITAIPNPLRDQTSIGFTIPQAGVVTLEILDALGRRVAALSESRVFHAGHHALIWNTRDLPSGIYVAVLRYGNSLKTLRLSVLK